MKPAHEALRDGTRAEHERLDALLGGFDLGERDSYARFLVAHAEALLPIEAALDDSAALVVDDWPERKRGAALLADLAGLGQAGPDGAAATAAGGGADDVATAAGALYVIEGSRLGGRFLVKQVGAGLPAAYLGAEQPRGRWPALLNALDQALPDDAARDRAVTAARAVFARFEAATRRQLDSRLCSG